MWWSRRVRVSERVWPPPSPCPWARCRTLDSTPFPPSALPTTDAREGLLPWYSKKLMEASRSLSALPLCCCNILFWSFLFSFSFFNFKFILFQSLLSFLGRLLQKAIRELAGLGEPTGLERDMTDGWSGLNLMAMTVSVNFFWRQSKRDSPPRTLTTLCPQFYRCGRLCQLWNQRSPLSVRNAGVDRWPPGVEGTEETRPPPASRPGTPFLLLSGGWRGGLVPSPMFSDSPHVSLSALPLSPLVPWLCVALAVLLDPSLHIYHQPLVTAESFLTLPVSTHDMTLFWFSRALLGRRLEGHL